LCLPTPCFGINLGDKLKIKWVIMKAVKKFKTFEQLKSDDSRLARDSSSLKRHNEFEKLITNIRENIKTLQQKVDKT